MSLDNLPVELIVTMMEGSSLLDILNVTRTSIFFHSIGRLSRSLWVNAQDIHRLPLPMGETLDTVSLSSISRLAAYATALWAVWRRPIASPRRISYKVPYYLRGLSVGAYIPPCYRGSILPGNQWLLVAMHTDAPRLYCLNNGEALPFIVGGSVVAYTYESFNNGSSIILALLRKVISGEPHEYPTFIDVYVIEFDAEQDFRTVPHVRRALSVRLPLSNVTLHIGLKGSLIVVSAGNELFIINWKEKSGVNLSPSLSLPPLEEQSEEQLLSMQFTWEVEFHPELPLLIAQQHSGRSGDSVHVINCPAALKPFDSAHLTDKSLRWHRECLVSTRLHTLPPQYRQEFMSFRRPDEGPLVLDMIYPLYGDPDLYHISISHLDTLTPTLSSPRIFEKIGSVFERRTAAGRTIFLGVSLDARFLFLLRMPESSCEAPTWVRLELPHGVKLLSIKTSVVAFDDVYGTLLLDDAVGNYLIVQY